MIPIFVLNWNGIADTIECIDSICEMDNVSFEIQLIDNGSSLEEQEKLVTLYENHDQVRLHLLYKNHGFAKAHNIVFDRLDTEGLDVDFIALLNNDTSVDKNWLSAVLATTKVYNADMVSSKMLIYDQPDLIDNTGHFMLNTGEILPIGHGQKSTDFQEVKSNIGACAGAALYSVAMIKDIGFFDTFFVTGYEDAEFGYTAFLAGYSSIYQPEAIVYHKKGKSISKVFNDAYAQKIQENIFYTYCKLTPAHVKFLNFPMIIFKYLSVIVMNLVFNRRNYQKIMLSAIWKTLIVNRKLIKAKRKAFYKDRNVSFFSILKKWTFFLIYDIKRFVKIFLKREMSSMDNYVNQV